MCGSSFTIEICNPQTQLTEEFSKKIELHVVIDFFERYCHKTCNQTDDPSQSIWSIICPLTCCTENLNSEPYLNGRKAALVFILKIFPDFKQIGFLLLIAYLCKVRISSGKVLMLHWHLEDPNRFLTLSAILFMGCGFVGMACMDLQ